MYINAKIRMYPVGIYLLNVNNENSRTRCVICSKLTKKTQERPHWHEDIKKHWHCSSVSIVNFEMIPHFFLVFHYWISGRVASWVYQQTTKYRQATIMKPERTDANYAILTKRIKQQHEKKAVLNLLSMQSLGFEQTFTKFIEIFISQE